MVEEKKIGVNQGESKDSGVGSMANPATPGASFDPGDPAMLSGQRVGPYELHELIGQGGMAAVYKSYQPGLDRYVAVKLILGAVKNRSDLLARFQQEMKAVGRLSHPNILPVYDSGIDRGITYLVMQYMSSGTLMALLGQPLPVAKAAAYAFQIAQGLQYAHNRGIVHRDIKPANILLSDDPDHLVIADFGIAKFLDIELKVTQMGTAIGTPDYMAPEQAKGAGVDGRTDIYSLGILLYHMLTARVPFRGETAVATIIQHFTMPLPDPRQFNPTIPEELQQVVAKACTKSIDGRFATAQDFANALRPFLGGLSGSLSERFISLPAPYAAQTPNFSSPVNPIMEVPEQTRFILKSPTTPRISEASHSPNQANAFRTENENALVPISASGSIIATLEKFGIPVLSSSGHPIRNSHFISCLEAASEITGARWAEFVAAGELEAVVSNLPLNTDEYSIDPLVYSQMTNAIEQLYPTTSTEMLKRWSRIASESSLKAKGASTAGKVVRLLPDGKRKMEVILNSWVKQLDDIRGEHLHSWKAIDANHYWVVHFHNLYALGRRKPEQSCAMWIASYEATLRFTGLANNWIVEEIECGCVTGYYNCVFALRRQKK